MSGKTYRQPSFVISKPPLFNPIREKERFELSILNDKFADYVEKVRYLESQNKKIQMETNILTEKQQESSQKIKTLFETEILQLKQIAEQLFQTKNTIITNSQDVYIDKPHFNQIFKEYDSSRYEIENLERQLSSVEGDILMYKRRLAHQDDEHTQWKHFTTHIQRLLFQAKNEIQNECLTRTSCEQTVKQIRLDINQLHEQQQQKLKDLQKSSFILNSNSTNDRTHMFKSELSNAIRRIRQDFDKQTDLHRNELYGRFTQTYEDISRRYPELSFFFLNDREQERIKQEEDRIRSELQRIKIDSQLLKQKNSELKLHIQELQINLEMRKEENKRIQQLQQNKINQFKLKHEKTIIEYEEVLTKQTTLEKEIETYRNLLEGTMKPVVDHITEEYNTISANQVKIDQTDALSNRKIRSENLNRMSSIPQVANTNDTNFISSITWNNKKQSRCTSMPVINFPIATKGNVTETTKFFEDLKNKNNDNHRRIIEKDKKTTKFFEDLKNQNNDKHQHIIEKIETTDNPSASNVRKPIIIQVRRKT
jgi:hypothetical protein